jgi:CSLREA domain-containing protein
MHVRKQIALACIIFIGLSIPLFAFAATFIPDSFVDEADASLDDGICKTVTDHCTLRAAIQQANQTPGEDTISLAPGIYLLSIPGQSEDQSVTGDLDLTDATRLIGWGADKTIIDGNQLDNVIDIRARTYISGVTLRNGLLAGINNAGHPLIINSSKFKENATGISEGYSQLMSADAQTFVERSTSSENTRYGGINHRYGNLTLHNSNIVNNISLDYGGGIKNSSTLLIVNSTISGNSAMGQHELGFIGGFGGGIWNFGDLTAINVTISGNKALDRLAPPVPGSGGGLYVGAGKEDLNHVTIIENTASASSGIFLGGGAFRFTMEASIVANNHGGNQCDMHSSFISLGHNIGGDSSCPFSVLSDQLQIDPLLESLQNNGGFTETHAPLKGSPAIDKISADCPPPNEDQRGIARPQGVACDIGAVEAVAQASGNTVDLFNLEVGNHWEYQYNRKKFSVDVTSVMTQEKPTQMLYVVDQKLNGQLLESDWYEIAPGEVLLWGGLVRYQRRNYQLRFSKGLTQAWYPLSVGQKRQSFANVDIDHFYSGKIYQTAEVIEKKSLPLAFGNVNAYRITFIQRLKGQVSISRRYSYWVVPKLGLVGFSLPSSPGAMQKLTAFSLNGGISNEQSDNDKDGWFDYLELSTGTNPFAADTDQDSLLDPADNCPTIANPDQADSDLDGVGDACNQIVTGSLKASTISDITIGARDKFSITIDQCSGLDDAVFEIAKKQVEIQVGSDQYKIPVATSWKMTVNGSLKSTVRLGKGLMTLTVDPMHSKISISGSGLTISNLANPIPITLSTPGWHCQTENNWQLILRKSGVYYQFKP